MATDANSRIRAGTVGVGLNHVGSYQSSGVPYLTASSLSATQNSGSVARFEFPRVAKSVTVKVITHNLAGGQGLLSDPVIVFFGEPKTSAGTERIGKDVYHINGTNAPLQYTQRHGYALTLVSGSSNGMVYGEQIIMGAKTDHVNIAVNGIGGPATGSFQIHAELTNISAERMPGNYISGSGVNTL